MRKLEALFPGEIAVIGVHCGKFTAERETAGIRDASVRLGALHPVLNDRQDPGGRTVQTWIRGLHEPSGLAIGGGNVYVAETNRHRVTVVDLATADVSELSLSTLSS